MELTTIRELFKNREGYLDKEVTVGGWIRSIRDSKTFGIMDLILIHYRLYIMIRWRTSLKFPS